MSGNESGKSRKGEEKAQWFPAATEERDPWVSSMAMRVVQARDLGTARTGTGTRGGDGHCGLGTVRRPTDDERDPSAHSVSTLGPRRESGPCLPPGLGESLGEVDVSQLQIVDQLAQDFRLLGRAITFGLLAQQNEEVDQCRGFLRVRARLSHSRF